MRSDKQVYNQSSRENDEECEKSFRDKSNNTLSNYPFLTLPKESIHRAKGLALSQHSMMLDKPIGWSGEGGSRIDFDSDLRNRTNYTSKRDFRGTQKRILF